MVFLLSTYGQRSNNLFQHVHIDSFCRENGVRFYNKFIYQLQEDYPAVGRPNWFFDFLLKFKLLRVLRRLRLVRYIDFDNVNLNEYYKDFVLKHDVVLCEGWFLWSNSTVGKHRKHYQNVFAPNVDRATLQKAFLTKEKLPEKLIGVHVRRGDYAQHEEGRYLFSDAVYIDKTQQLVRELQSSCKVLVFTNDENLDKAAYQRAFPRVLFSDRTAVEDHYLMSQCDYLLGPPSTFNMWASYMGDVPLYHVYEANATVSVADFKVIHT